MRRRQTPWLTAGGVGYTAWVLTHSKIGEPLRDVVNDAASDHLPRDTADMVDALLSCPFCAGFWIGLVAAKGNPVKAMGLAGLGSIVSSLILLATGD